MGSVSSLISGHSFHSKHCRASQYKLRKSSHLKKLNRYSDGLLRFGFSQDSGHKSGSKSSKNEDFFYIKVSQKSQRPDYTALGGGELGAPAGSSALDFGTPTPQKLMPFPSQLEVVSGEKRPWEWGDVPFCPQSVTTGLCWLWAVRKLGEKKGGGQLGAAFGSLDQQRDLKDLHPLIGKSSSFSQKLPLLSIPPSPRGTQALSQGCCPTVGLLSHHGMLSLHGDAVPGVLSLHGDAVPPWGRCPSMRLLSQGC